jgi:hypothetical protein
VTRAKGMLLLLLWWASWFAAHLCPLVWLKISISGFPLNYIKTTVSVPFLLKKSWFG